MVQLPEAFCERMRQLLGDQYEAFAPAMSGSGSGTPPKRPEGRAPGRRLGGGGRGLEAVTGFSFKKFRGCREGFYYREGDRPGKHPCHEAGVYYIQEPSAMAVVELLDPMPGTGCWIVRGARGASPPHCLPPGRGGVSAGQ